MNLSEVEVLSPKLGGPLPKRGGMPCPVLPWLKNYTGLSPIGHAQAASSHWDPGFLLHAITWGGRELLRCEQLHVLEHPTFVLPHFQTRSQGHTLVTPAGDFAGPDAFALLLGLARESEKTLLAVKQCNSPADAIRLLVGPHQEEWAHFEQTHAPLSLLDLVQDLSVGGEQRFVAWAPIASAAEPSLQALVSKHEGPISLFVGQTHRIWDGLSPFPRLFEKDLLAFSGDAKDRFLGLDLLRTHHPETQKERLQTERSHGLSSFDDVIAIQCGQINLKQIDALFVPALKKLQQQNQLLLLIPPKSKTLKTTLQCMNSPPEQVFLLLEGPSFLKEMMQVKSLYDVRRRKTVSVASPSLEGIQLNTLPSLGFLPGAMQGHFDSVGAHLLEAFEKDPQLHDKLSVYFSPIGLHQGLLRMSSNLLGLCAQSS